MKKRSLYVPVLLLAGVVLSGCGPSQAELDATATQAAAAAFATQTALAPTATPTYTPSPTPTKTPTPTNTPTATPTPKPTNSPTATPAPTQTNTPAVAPTSGSAKGGTTKPAPTSPVTGSLLKLADLPTGFVEMPAEQLGDMGQGMPEGTRAFGYTSAKGDQIVMGMLIPYPGQTDQRLFDTTLPFMVAATLAGVGASGDAQELEGLDDVGEARAAATSVSEMGAISFRWDIVGFRRGDVGVILIVAYSDGEKPSATAGDLARLLDGRIQKGQGSPTS
jgi:hypothetical protein